ncbi:MAG: adenosylcobalamin-dependent ribonucleoside-diphosphate reductase, partial [Proteobacteria bacterium]|nr:adenosylcobalamin-dependent ribonucleoside-diphosphate reductase [Pseudomonadota bacterium]
AKAEKKWGGPSQVKHWRSRFLSALTELEFLPNSPTLMNAGTPLGQLSACFVLPVEDDLIKIFDALKLMAIVQQSGGGTGFSFSKLRMKGDPVSVTSGVASGPVSFMKIFDVATENIRQGGKRRGANMAVLRIDHPDIEEFIEAKRNLETLTNFNLSIGMTDAFMRAAAKGQNHALIDPFDGKKKRVVSARALLKEIATAAWKTGDPGLIFLDAMNRENPTPHLGPIEATNPCGEVPLLPYEACNLGSINLTKMVQKSGHGWEIDWKKLEETVAVAVRFLDNVIEVGKWPCSQIENQVKGNRKIGLGVMGFAELLVLMKIPYDSMQAVETASSLMRTISDLAWKSSQELAL